MINLKNLFLWLLWAIALGGTLSFYILPQQVRASDWWVCDYVWCPDENLTTDPTINDVGDNPLTEWVDQMGKNIEGLNTPWIGDSLQARDEGLRYIKKYVDYFLALLWLVALIYLIWWGLEMITAMWTEAKYEEWFKKLKRALIAIAGIGLSWYIVSRVFYFVNETTKEDSAINIEQLNV